MIYPAIEWADIQFAYGRDDVFLETMFGYKYFCFGASYKHIGLLQLTEGEIDMFEQLKLEIRYLNASK